ncbi:hypothetical protein [Streptococcus penaeicida]|uniref:hypothetical protein n=1 Tax=Streptococcus penaeicida TaxID=1765960 RepID=UPI003CCB9335
MSHTLKNNYESDDQIVMDYFEYDLHRAFTDLKNEILLGHRDILEGKISSLSDVREEFGLS